ncbi:protein naked cuticle homolog 1-like isoform X2 [Mya arenaria]|uniref:protein naked cuticle homolog 1-like isoform X2 n=1 Tax=Mya arenaria TaxID=6604 RepID=UPI0022E8D51D|nr:protein naked cuticle homolog 1-like isoform X2 [Mya arenaria]XP_052817140.1 protein naked cuticle homolog 1-like isoform X2 [Mya arenaria]
MNRKMGKNASKHECFLVNAHLNKAWEEQVWKKTTKTGYNLANYNMNQSLSELSICLEDKQDNSEKKDNNKDTNVPLKVELPPIKVENGKVGKVFTFDQDDDLEKGGKETGESRLNIEEFECGVHFGGGENAKQEWSFTLYDFDGHGKITKEDLVGLLKALYDAIGSSIKIPNNGTKTLKLRLSVGQEASISTETSPVSEGGKATKANNEKEEKEKPSPKKKDNSKVKVKESHADPKVKESLNFKSKDSAKYKDNGKVKIKDISRLNNLVGPRGSLKCTNEAQAEAQAGAKTKVSTHKHKELVNLVQENMERNHVKPVRRHHSDCRGCPPEHRQGKSRQRSARTNSAKENNMKQLKPPGVSKSANNSPAKVETDAPKECQDRRNYYLDLAGVENNSSKFQDNSTAALETGKSSELNNSQVKNSTSSFQPVKPFSALSAGQFCVPKHFRSRSHEHATVHCDPTSAKTNHCPKNDEVSSFQTEHFRSRSFDPQDSNVSNVRATKGNPPLLMTSPTLKQSQPQSQTQSMFRPVSLPPQIPEIVSPFYHRRHRHREKNHHLAMQQVAEWIEREHTVDYEGDKIVIQRHEHHHVHEHHHHHHYHHYYEA